MADNKLLKVDLESVEKADLYVSVFKCSSVDVRSTSGGVIVYSDSSDNLVYLSNDKAYKGAKAPSEYGVHSHGYKYAWSGYGGKGWSYMPMVPCATKRTGWAVGDPITQEVLSSGALDSYLPIRVSDVHISGYTIKDGIIAKLNRPCKSGETYYLMHNCKGGDGTWPVKDKKYTDLVKRVGHTFTRGWVLSGLRNYGGTSLCKPVIAYIINYQSDLSESEVTLKTVKSRDVDGTEPPLTISNEWEWDTMNKTYSIKTLVEKLTAAKGVQAEAIKAAGTAGLKAAQEQMAEFMRTGKSSTKKYPVVILLNPVEAYDNALEELSLLAGDEVQAQDLGFDPLKLIREAGEVAAHERAVYVGIN